MAKSESRSTAKKEREGARGLVLTAFQRYLGEICSFPHGEKHRFVFWAGCIFGPRTRRSRAVVFGSGFRRFGPGQPRITARLQDGFAGPNWGQEGGLGRVQEAKNSPRSMPVAPCPGWSRGTPPKSPEAWANAAITEGRGLQERSMRAGWPGGSTCWPFQAAHTTGSVFSASMYQAKWASSSLNFWSLSGVCRGFR